MDKFALLFYIMVFLLGTLFGSFLNVCILRIPAGESIVTGRSHCPNCKRRLNWYELFPVFSYIALRGRCAGCKVNISAQYPLIEAANGILWMLVFQRFGLVPEALIGALLASFLLALSLIDERTKEIPPGINMAVLALGIIASAIDYQNLASHIIGAFAISVPTALIFYLSSGRGIGGGDVKLMAACGLYLGWQLIIFAFFTGCFLGAVIHLLRMRLSSKGRVLALGPYLSAGVFIALIWGVRIIDGYIGLLA